MDPSALLVRLLSIDPDADVYLLARAADALPACRLFLHHGVCANKRCRFDHKVTISAASRASDARDSRQPPVRPRARSRGKSLDDANESEPALELDAGLGRLLWPRGDRAALPPALENNNCTGFGGLLALPELALHAVIDALPEQGMCQIARGCKQLRALALDSRAVSRCKERRLPALRANRVRTLRGGSNPSRLRYAVTRSFAKVEGVDGPDTPQCSVLAHDHADLDVWRQFEQAFNPAAAC